MARHGEERDHSVNTKMLSFMIQSNLAKMNGKLDSTHFYANTFQFPTMRSLGNYTTKCSDKSRFADMVIDEKVSFVGCGSGCTNCGLQFYLETNQYSSFLNIKPDKWRQCRVSFNHVFIRYSWVSHQLFGDKSIGEKEVFLQCGLLVLL